MYNVGVGPVDTKLGRRMLRDLAELMDFITVRDRESEEVLKDLGVQNPRILLGADPALNVKPASDARVDKVLEGLGFRGAEQILALNINRYLNIWARPRQEPLEKEVFLSTYATAINRVASETDASLLLVSTQHHDVSLTRELMGRLSRARRKALLSNVEFSHSDIAGVLSRAQLLFGMRLHCLILCSTSMTPCVGLAYQPKIKSFMEDLGIAEGCLEFDRFSEEEIYVHVMNGWEKRAALRSQLEKRIPAMKNEALKAADLVAAIHRGEDIHSAFGQVYPRHP
jgi:polysaccharide pyruvyl transferase WcaK-like protein